MSLLAFNTEFVSHNHTTVRNLQIWNKWDLQETYEYLRKFENKEPSWITTCDYLCTDYGLPVAIPNHFQTQMSLNHYSLVMTTKIVEILQIVEQNLARKKCGADLEKNK